MAYCKRPDGKIAVSIDSNAWNKLFDAKVALATELPSDRFKLFLPREIEIETHCIPNAADKIQLRDYIAQQVHEAENRNNLYFGLCEYRWRSGEVWRLWVGNIPVRRRKVVLRCHPRTVSDWKARTR